MTKLNCYLNFNGNTEEVFNFYKSVFGTEFQGEIMRFRDVPDMPGVDKLSEKDGNAVMHVALPVGDNMLMGSDTVEGVTPSVTMGTNINLSLHPDSREEADRLYKALSEGGEAQMPMADVFWGDYWGLLKDKFGVLWMINYSKK